MDDVEVVFNSTDWSYDVFVNTNHIANIHIEGGLSQADASSNVFSTVYAAPMPYNLQSNEGFVNGLYVDSFSRVSDSIGLSYWTEQLTLGASRKTLIQEVLTSSEYNDQHLGNSEFVGGIYQNILGRYEDTSGANYWSEQLDAGASRADVVGYFLASYEFNNLVGIS
jgi:hypothetical protein